MKSVSYSDIRPFLRQAIVALAEWIEASRVRGVRYPPYAVLEARNEHGRGWREEECVHWTLQSLGGLARNLDAVKQLLDAVAGSSLEAALVKRSRGSFSPSAYPPGASIVGATVLPVAEEALGAALPLTPTDSDIEAALDTLEDRLTRNVVDVRASVLLDGPELEGDQALADGLTLRDASSELLTALVGGRAGIASDDELGQAFRSTAVLEAAQEFDLDAVAFREPEEAVHALAKRGVEAMRLAVDDATVAWQPMTHGATACDYSPHSLLLGRTPFVNRVRPWPWVQPSQYASLVTALEVELPGPVQLARDRLARPFELGSRDPILDYWIGLEALVLPKKAPELKYRAAIRLAYLCASTPEERKQVFGDAKASYDIRSSVIHGSRVDMNERKAGTEAARHLLRHALRAFVLDGVREPDLDDLVLGFSPDE